MRLSASLRTKGRGGKRVVVTRKRNNWRVGPGEAEVPVNLEAHFRHLGKVGDYTVVHPGERHYRQLLALIPAVDDGRVVDDITRRLVAVAATTTNVNPHLFSLAFRRAARQVRMAH